MKIERRKRSYIPLPERLAAALACLLPQEVRDDLRRRKVPAQEVISMFHNDHLAFHALGGADKWWNLDPKIIGDHREKTRKDISAIAKVRRNEKQWSEFTRAVAAGVKPEKREAKSKWPKRSFPKKNGEVKKCRSTGSR